MPEALSRSVTDTILFYGQSNAGPAGVSSPVLTEPRFGDIVMSFRTKRQSYGNEEAKLSELSGLGPLYDHPKYPPSPSTAMGFALGHRQQEQNDLSKRYFFFTSWEGGMPLSRFKRGTESWHNLMAAILKSSHELRKANSDNIIKAIVFVQGEGGPYGREVYRRELIPLLQDLQHASMQENLQTEIPTIILLQTNKGSAVDGGPSNVELAHWDAAQQLPSVVLAGPMYYMPLSDNIHQDAVGRMLQGELLALVYDIALNRKQAFRPLHPVQAKGDGSRILVTFSRPRDSSGLKMDHDWIASSDNFGFSYVTSKGPEKIESVNILDDDTVEIRLSSTHEFPGGTLLYAQEQARIPGWASARGQLYCESGEASYYASMVPDYPPGIRHYCIRSALPVEAA